MENGFKRAVLEILKITGLLAVLQLARFGIKSLCFLAVERTWFTDRAASFAAMLILSVLIVLIARRRGFKLSVFPERFGVLYIVITLIASALLISTPFITKKYDAASLLGLVYGSAMTPIFEELIFRSVVWNRLKTVFKREWTVYIVTTLLFALWHFGYIDSVALRAGTGIMNIMVWKAITGLCFGAVLGAVRLKSKNSYSTMLLHGIMNLFGR